MAIPEGFASVARGSGVARGLLDAAKELGLDPKTAVRTTSTSGYMVPAEVADRYNKNIAKANAETEKPKATPKTKVKAEQKTDAAEADAKAAKTATPSKADGEKE